MNDDLRTALQPLVELLSKPDPTSTDLSPEEQTEFAERLESERKAEVENTRKQMMRSVVAPLEKWQAGVLARLKAVEDKPTPEPVVQQIVQAAPEVQRMTRWKLRTVERSDGLARTVVASAGGDDRWRITIDRTPDGFPMIFDAQAIEPNEQ